VRQAAGENLSLGQLNIRPSGCSIEARVYAEDPAKNFHLAPACSRTLCGLKRRASRLGCKREPK